MDASAKEQLEFKFKVQAEFLQKTDQYRTVLNFSQKEVSMISKSILWDMHRELNQKLLDLEYQIEQRIQDIALQSQQQLELIVQVESIIEEDDTLISAVPKQQMQAVQAILAEGVDVNLKRWEAWRQKNISYFLEEITQSKRTYAPFLDYKLGNYIGVDEETGRVGLLGGEEEKQDDDESILGKFKHLISGVVKQASSFKPTSRKGSINQPSAPDVVAEPQEHLHTLSGHQQHVYSCIQLSDGSYATSSFDGSVRVWNRDDYRVEYASPHLKTAYNDIVEITNHKLDEDAYMFAVANDDGSIKLFLKPPGRPWAFYKELPKVKEGSPFHLVYDAKCNFLLYNTQRNGRIIQIYDMTTFKVSNQFPHKFTQSSAGTCIALLPAEQRFLSADLTGFIYKWSYSSRQPLIKFRAHDNCLNHIAILRDFRVATCCQDGLVKLWSGSLLGSKPLQVYQHKYPLWSLCASEKILMSGDVEGYITYHCLDTLAVRKSLKAHHSGIFMLKESKGNFDKHFTSSSEDFKAKLWSLR